MNGDFKFSGKVKTSKGINCRDPFILVYENEYYLYNSFHEKGVFCYKSKDLENWSDPIKVLENENPDYNSDMFFAPECHYYNGNFYMITSCKSDEYGVDTISIYKAEKPWGPFKAISYGITPKNDDYIDGTLYVDENKEPYLIFSKEFLKKDPKGKIMLAHLSKDLTEIVVEPEVLFTAYDPVWSDDRVAEAPFIVKKGRTLYMLWSNYVNHKYVIALAKSVNGIKGPWDLGENVLYKEGIKKGCLEGGHAMVFTSPCGKEYITFHSPNTFYNKIKGEGEFERVIIKPIEEQNGTLVIKDL